MEKAILLASSRLLLGISMVSVELSISHVSKNTSKLKILILFVCNRLKYVKKLSINNLCKFPHIKAIGTFVSALQVTLGLQYYPNINQ